MNYNIIYKDNNVYKILNKISIHHFLNKDNSINQHVLGLYVNQLGGNHVLQQDNKFLICEIIQEAEIIE
jgi:hypothetical protein